MSQVKHAVALLVGLTFYGAALPGCATAPTLALVECKLASLAVLPAEPMLVTPADARELVRRLNSCESRADAGPK